MSKPEGDTFERLDADLLDFYERSVKLNKTLLDWLDKSEDKTLVERIDQFELMIRSTLSERGCTLALLGRLLDMIKVK